MHAIRIHDPGHNLGISVHIRRGNIAGWANEKGYFRGIATRQAFDFVPRHRFRVAAHTAFGTAKGDVDHRAFPGHPHGQGTHLVKVDKWRVANAAFGGSSGHVMLDAITGKHLGVTVIHDHGKGNGKFAVRGSKDFLKPHIESQSFCDLVELSLGNGKGIILHESLGRHRFSFSLCLLDKSFAEPFRSLPRFVAEMELRLIHQSHYQRADRSGAQQFCHRFEGFEGSGKELGQESWSG